VTNTQAQFEALARVLGHPEWLEDARFATLEVRLQHRVEMTCALEPALATRSAAAWETIFEHAVIPACRVRTIPEVLAEQQVKRRGFVHVHDTAPGVSRPIKVPTAGFLTDGAALAPATPPPALGQDTDAVLAELGLSEAEIAALRTARAI